MISKDKLLKGMQGHNSQTGEGVNLKYGFLWILQDLDYYNFCKLARLTFHDTRGDRFFTYTYDVLPEDDNEKARKEFIQYLLYKLVQNLSTPGIELAH